MGAAAQRRGGFQEKKRNLSGRQPALSGGTALRCYRRAPQPGAGPGESSPHRGTKALSCFAADQPEESEKPALLQDGRFALEGFRNRDLQNQWPDPVADDPQEKRRTARLTRWLRLRRAHRMIAKLPRTHSYRLTRKGRAVITSAVTARKANVSALAA